MANAVQIEVGGVAYPVKDTTARQDVASINNALKTEVVHLLSSPSDWQQGTFNSQGSYTDRVRAGESTTRIIVKARENVKPGDKVVFDCPAGYKYRAFFSANTGAINLDTSYIFIDDGYSDLNTWYTADRTIVTPDGAASFFMAIAYDDDSTITPSDLPDFPVYILTIGAELYTVENTTIKGIEDGYIATELIASWQNAYYNPNGSANAVSSTTRCCTDKIIPVSGAKYLKVDCPVGMKSRITYWSNTARGSSNLVPTTFNTNWKSGLLVERIPSNAVVFGVSVAFDDNSTISTSDCADVGVYAMTNGQKLKEQTISILGDSISTFAGDNAPEASDEHLIADGTYTYSGNHCRYPNADLKAVGDTYWMQLINRYGMRLGVNDSWAGSRVTWNGSETSDAGEDKYIASPTRIGHLGGNGTPDMILVNAGTNDIHASGVEVGTFNTESPKDYTDAQIDALPVATFADAYRAMLIRLQKAYPLAKIVVMLPNYTTSYYDPTTADAFLEVIKEACDYFGVKWIDMRTSGVTMYNTSYYMPDGIHPNIDGMWLLFARVAECLDDMI